jgi:monoamine oxidase
MGSGMQAKAYDVVIIGAELAGLIAARDLLKSGHSVVVLEARDRIGGRLFADTLKARTVFVDMGGNWIIPGVHTATEEELERYGIATDHTPDPDSYVTLIDGIGSAAGALDEDQVAALSSGLARAQQLATQEITFGDLLGAAEVRKDVTGWISAVLRFLNGASLGEVSGADFSRLPADEYASPDHYSKAIKGTTMALVNAVASDAGAQIHKSSRVRTVEQTGEAIRVTDHEGRAYEARHVIVAAPVNTLHEIEFSPEIAGLSQLTQRGHAGHSVKLWFTLRGVVGYPRLMSDTGTICYARVHSQLPNGETLFVGFSDQISASDITIGDLQADIVRFLPDAEVTSVEAYDWNGDRNAQGTWMATRPGQSAILNELAGLGGAIRFIGGDFSTDAPGTIEGAIRSGRDAAAAIGAAAT